MYEDVSGHKNLKTYLECIRLILNLHLEINFKHLLNQAGLSPFQR